MTTEETLQVAFTIGSIDLGVLGFMTLWGVNLVSTVG